MRILVCGVILTEGIIILWEIRLDRCDGRISSLLDFLTVERISSTLFQGVR